MEATDTMPYSPTALFVGAANLDRHARLMSPHVAATSNRAAVLETAGGVSLNMASRFAACGGRATLKTALGQDAAATMIRQTLDDRGVTLQADTAERTGTFASILEPGGELVTAVSDMVALDEYEPEIPTSGYDWVVVDANLSQRALKGLTNGSPPNLALATVSTAKAPRLIDVLNKAAIIFTNIPELAALSGNAAEPFQWFRARTAAILVASDGPRPLWLLDDEDVTPFPIPQSDTIVDVLGAGDALAGTMLHAMAIGKSLAGALAAGLDAAARTVQVAGPYLPPDA